MDRSLAVLIRSFQTTEHHEEAQRLIPSTTGLLIRLSNPLNITLLASQILKNDAFYPQPVRLSDCRRIFSAFYTASARVVASQGKEEEFGPDLTPNEWTKAAIRGADEGSPRWRHCLLLGGILLGLSSGTNTISSHIKSKLESALVTASNLVLAELPPHEQGSRICVLFVLNQTFALLSDSHRAQIQYTNLLPLAIEATFFSDEGLQQGYWLASVDADVREISGRKFAWSSHSPSFGRLRLLKSNSLLSNLGPLAQLTAHAIDSTTQPKAVLDTVVQLALFAKTIATSWRQMKLSEIDVSEESQYLDSQTMQTTLPVLWQLLRETFFAIIIILRSAVGRTLCDPYMATHQSAPFVAVQTLHILRHLEFIGARLGQTSTAQYTFVNFAAIDILNQYPEHMRNFLQAIRPTNIGYIPRHPLDRTNDLFFLNTAEHFTMTASPGMNENLILAAAIPYISSQAQYGSTELYEAAHSVALAVFAVPSCADLAARQIPTYVETVMQSFPQKLSPQQFRLALRSITRIAKPPSALSKLQPFLPMIVMEMLAARAASASETMLPSGTTEPVNANQAMSEKSIVNMALIDCLPDLALPLLSDWLTRTAVTVNQITDLLQRQACRQRFWEIVSSGEMDQEHSVACVFWWNSRGGRELLLENEQTEEDVFSMSGTLPSENKL